MIIEALHRAWRIAMISDNFLLDLSYVETQNLFFAKKMENFSNLVGTRVYSPYSITVAFI